MSISKNIATKAVLIGGLLLTGCGLTNREFSLDGTFGKDREKRETTFFIGSVLHNPQNEFNLNERITISADIKNYYGDLTTRIWNEKTRHIVKTAKVSLSDKTTVEYSFNAFDLYHRPFGGEGKYYVAWYIGDELMKREDFSIKK